MSTRIPHPPTSAPEILLRTLRQIWTHPENRNRRARALAGYFGWQAWERTVRRPVTVKLTGGIKVRCHPHSPIASAVIYYGLADPAEMRFVLGYLQPGDTFVDVGANVGVYSLLAASVPDVRVLALEPSSQAWTRASENVRLNRLETRVTLLKQAAGRTAGPGRLTVGLDAMNSLVESESRDSTEAVSVDTLDRLAAEHALERVALIKVDVEGWETDVLEGAAELIRRHRPALIVEVNDVESLEEFAATAGYSCIAYVPGSRTVEPASLAAFKGHNAILVPDPEAASMRLGVHREGSPSSVSELRRVAARSRACLREQGGARTVGKAAARLGSYLVYPAQKLLLRSRTFEISGRHLPYVIHHYNETWRNERAVELAIVKDALQNCEKPVLEIGNVLSHYLKVDHEVVDKYEEVPGVRNIDVVDLEASGSYGFIFSISTLEHVGWDEDPKDPNKVLLALSRLRGALREGGELLVTCPLGYNPFLDELITLGNLGASEEHFFARRGTRVSWREISKAEVGQPPFPALDQKRPITLWVARFTPSRDS